jgi:hypothetical protein
MNPNLISPARALRTVGSAGLIVGILTVFSASLAYAPTHAGFSIFNTYLSDISDTPGWAQILFNSGTLLGAPLRFAILVLLVICLRSFWGKCSAFEIIFLSLGAFSTLGTVLMTAVPFSLGPAIHKSGIGLYFLGAVFMQALLGMKQLSIPGFPRVLPALSFSIVASYLLFFALFILYESGLVDRSTPVFWEWMCFFTSMTWLAGHAVLLGNDPPAVQAV